MASMIARNSGMCLQRCSRPSVTKMALPSRSFIRKSAGPSRQAKFVPRAETESSVDTEQIMKDLQAKWDKVENKTQVVIYGVGALVALYFSSSILGSINRFPLIPRVFELVGLGYSAWFTYRYLLFKSSRLELIKDVEDLKNKLAGDQ